MLPALLFANQRHSFNTLSLKSSQAFLLPTSSPSPQVGTILILAAIELGVDIPITVNTIYEADIDILSLPVDQIAEKTSVSFRTLYTSLLSIQRQNVVKLLVRPTLRNLRLSINSSISTPQRSVLHYICHGLDSQPATATGSLLLYDDNIDVTSRQTKVQLVSIDDVIKVIGDHMLFILDCNYAGSIINTIRELNVLEHNNILVLAATSSTERLPLWVSSLNCYPVDIFTQCLLNPVKVYVFSYVRKAYQSASPPCTYEQCDSIYRYLQNPSKREFLNSILRILKLVCETIAWSSLPRDVFNRLYRQDKCVSILFTNFILAQRIMKGIHLTAQALPAFPDTTTHRLWDLFDAMFNASFLKLRTLDTKSLDFGILPLYFERQTIKDMKADGLSKFDLHKQSSSTHHSLQEAQQKNSSEAMLWHSSVGDLSVTSAPSVQLTGHAPSKGSSISSTANQSFIKKKAAEPASILMVSFLQDQLRTFELWLLNVHPSTEVPDVLPFVIVSIKLQQLRSRALDLIAHFIDMSPWCLRATLELRLLQTILHGIYTFHECESDQFRCILILCKILVSNYSVISLIVNSSKRNSGSGAAASKGHIEDVLCEILVQATTSTDMRILCLIILTCLTTNQAIIDAHQRYQVSKGPSGSKDAHNSDAGAKGNLSMSLNSSLLCLYKSVSASPTSGFGFYLPQNARGDDPSTIAECCMLMRESLLKKNMIEVLLVLLHSASEHVKLWSLLLLSELMQHLSAATVSSKSLRSNRHSTPVLPTFNKTISASNSMIFTTSSSNLLATSTRMMSLTFVQDPVEEITTSLRSADELVLSAHENFKQPESVLAYAENFDKIHEIYKVITKIFEPIMTVEIRAAAVSVVTSSLPVVDLAPIVITHRVVDVFSPGNVPEHSSASSSPIDPEKGVSITPPDIVINIVKLSIQDISPLVRHEALCCLARFITLYFQSFIKLATEDLIMTYKMYENPYVRIFDGFHAHKVHYIVHAVYDALKQIMYDPVSTLSIRARNIFDGLSSLALCLLLQTTPISDDFFKIDCRTLFKDNSSFDQSATKSKIDEMVKQVFTDTTMRQIRFVMQRLSLVRDVSAEQVEHVLVETLQSVQEITATAKTPIKLPIDGEKAEPTTTDILLRSGNTQDLSVSMFSKMGGPLQPPDNDKLNTFTSTNISDNSFLTASIAPNDEQKMGNSSDHSDLLFEDIDATIASLRIDPESNSEKVAFLKSKFLILQILDAFWLNLSMRICMPYITVSLYNCVSVILTLSRSSIRLPSICSNIEIAAAVAAQDAHRSIRICPIHSLLSIKDFGASYYRMHNTCCPCGRPALASLPLFLKDYVISPLSTMCLTIDPQVASVLLSMTKSRVPTDNSVLSSGCYSNMSHHRITSLVPLKYNYSDFAVTDVIRSNSVDLEDMNVPREYIFNSSDCESSPVQLAMETNDKGVWPSLFDLSSRKLSAFNHDRLQSYFHFALLSVRAKRRSSLTQDILKAHHAPLIKSLVVKDMSLPGIPSSSYSALSSTIYASSFNAILPKLGESYLYAVKTNVRDARRLAPCTPVVFTDNAVNIGGSKEQEKYNLFSNNKTNVLSLISSRRRNINYLGNNINVISSIQRLADHQLFLAAKSSYWDAKIGKLFDCPLNLLTLLAQNAKDPTFNTLQHMVDDLEHMHVIDHLCYFCRNAAVINPILVYCMGTMRIWEGNGSLSMLQSPVFHLTRDVNPLGTRSVIEDNAEMPISGKPTSIQKAGYRGWKGKSGNGLNKLASGKAVPASDALVRSKIQTSAAPFSYLESLAYCELSQLYYGDESSMSYQDFPAGYLLPYVCALSLYNLFFEFSNYLMVSLNDAEQSSMIRYTQHSRSPLFAADNPPSIIQTRRNFLMEIQNRITAAINDIDYERLSDSLNKIRFLPTPDKKLSIKSISSSQQTIASTIQQLTITSEGSGLATQRSSSTSKSTTQGSKADEVLDNAIKHIKTTSFPEGLFVLEMLPKVDSAHSLGSDTISMTNLRQLGIPSQTSSQENVQDSELKISYATMTEADLIKSLHMLYPEQKNYLNSKFCPVKKTREVREAIHKAVATHAVSSLSEYGVCASLKHAEKTSILRKIRSISHGSGILKNIVFHTNEAIFLTSNGSACCVWNTLTGELLNKLSLDTILDIQPISWPGGGLLSGHLHAPKFMIPQVSQPHSLINFVANNCGAPESIVLANMLEADALALECMHCRMLQATRTQNYNVLKPITSSLLEALSTRDHASAEDVEPDELDQLFLAKDGDSKEALSEKNINAYARMNELVRRRRGPYAVENSANFIGDIVLLNQYAPHSVLAVAAADRTIRILTNYHDASLCRHVSGFNVSSPPTNPLYLSSELQRIPYTVAELYRHKFNTDLKTPDAVLSHHRKQYIISRSKICNALFYERTGDTKQFKNWDPFSSSVDTIPILKGCSDASEMHTVAPHIITCLKNNNELTFIDLVRESKYMTLTCSHLIHDLVPINSTKITRGVLAYSNRDYSIFDPRSKQAILEGKAPESIIGGSLYGDNLFLATSAGRLLSKNIATGTSLKSYLINNPQSVAFHPTGLFSYVESVPPHGESANPVNSLTHSVSLGYISGLDLGRIVCRASYQPVSHITAFHPRLPLLAIPEAAQVSLWSI